MLGISRKAGHLRLGVGLGARFPATKMGQRSPLIRWGCFSKLFVYLLRSDGDVDVHRCSCFCCCPAGTQLSPSYFSILFRGIPPLQFLFFLFF
ncbi:hypothetical protein AQUCO_10500016v1 [Aquilegia coerulea]|uniref:Uncharacterized protein n=1 Tax=Aquilegia coerulea TaxID=218851 RepID=A0A2G5C3M0_AQUCA|nr:hypothetical protein AQUCO_10500016v1 [Aquilegia coerulea]